MPHELPKDGTIEAGLFVLEQLSYPGVEWELDEIAIACGTSRQHIFYFQEQAKKKIRLEFERRGLTIATII